MSWLQHLSAQVVRIMLDYTDQVSFCTKLKDTLKEQKQWLEICHIQSKSCHDPALVVFHLSGGKKSVLMTSFIDLTDFIFTQETHGA